MEILITVLITIAIIFAVFLITALFVKKEYAIQKDIIINKPSLEVFNYIKYLKNQDKYSKWVMTDPNMNKDFRGTDGAVGFVYAWEGNQKAGKGEQEIKGLIEGERLDIEVRFEKPFKGVAHTPFRTESVGRNQTKVIWGMQGKSSYPMNLANLFLTGMLKKDLEISLSNLKRILENG